MSTDADNEMRRLVVWDRHMGLLSLAMWGGTALKVRPHISPAENVQSWVGFAIIFLLAVAWPTLAYSSYVRWRVAGVSVLRISLFALPFNFSLAVFEAIAPEINRGRLALISNMFQLFMSIRIALLSFTSLGWRVPFRLHMVPQAINIWILVRFGMHTYCRSKLLTSPEVAAMVASVHSAMTFVAVVFVPGIVFILPSGAYPQLVAALLFVWLILGWLIPTLMLLPDAPSAEEEARRVGGAGARQAGRLTLCMAWLANNVCSPFESGLRTLLPSGRGVAAQHAQHAQQQGMELPSLATSMLHWWALLVVTWGLCCTVAPFFPQPATLPAV